MIPEDLSVVELSMEKLMYSATGCETEFAPTFVSFVEQENLGGKMANVVAEGGKKEGEEEKNTEKNKRGGRLKKTDYDIFETKKISFKDKLHQLEVPSIPEQHNLENNTDNNPNDNKKNEQINKNDDIQKNNANHTKNENAQQDNNQSQHELSDNHPKKNITKTNPSLPFILCDTNAKLTSIHSDTFTPKMEEGVGGFGGDVTDIPPLAEAPNPVVEKEDTSSSSDDSSGDEATEALQICLRESEDMKRKIIEELGGDRIEDRKTMEKKISNGRCSLGASIPNTKNFDPLIQTAQANMQGTDFSTLKQILHRLKPYQTVGLNWLYTLHKAERSGILADEMGLGKTAQTCVFLSLLYGCDMMEDRPSIICAPASLLDNWMTELERWAPSLRAIKYHGKQADRRLMAMRVLRGCGRRMGSNSSEEEEVEEEEEEEEKAFNIIVTSPQTLTNKWDAQYLKRVRPFAYLCVDEAHQLKNKDALVFKKLNRICKCKNRILLTGSPVQNKTSELRNLLMFVMPSLFEEERLDAAMEGYARQGGSEGEDGEVALLQQLLAPFILRRLKDEVLIDLPSKHSSIISCQLGGVQKNMYLQEISQTNKGRESSKFVRSRLCRLRRICNHPLLFQGHHSSARMEELINYFHKKVAGFRGSPLSKVEEEIRQWSDFEIHQQAAGIPQLAWTQLRKDDYLTGVKIRELLSLVKDLKKKGHKGLVFSQYTTFLDVVTEALHVHLPDLKFYRLDGTTSIGTRQELVDSFCADPEITIFLLSTKAGGQGLNLSAANTVILMDQDWNPHNDRQAEDRVHRLGQTSDVQIYRLCCRGTVEESILRCCQKKLDLDEAFGGNTDKLQAAILQDSLALKIEDDGEADTSEERAKNSAENAENNSAKSEPQSKTNSSKDSEKNCEKPEINSEKKCEKSDENSEKNCEKPDDDSAKKSEKLDENSETIEKINKNSEKMQIGEESKKSERTSNAEKRQGGRQKNANNEENKLGKIQEKQDTNSQETKGPNLDENTGKTNPKNETKNRDDKLKERAEIGSEKEKNSKKNDKKNDAKQKNSRKTDSKNSTKRPQQSINDFLSSKKPKVE